MPVSDKTKLRRLRKTIRNLQMSVRRLKKLNKRLREKNFTRFTNAPVRVIAPSKEPTNVLDARRDRMRLIKKEMNLSAGPLARLLCVSEHTLRHQIMPHGTASRVYISAMEMELAERLLLEYRQSKRQRERYLKQKHREWLEQGGEELEERLKSVLLPDVFTDLEIRRQILRFWITNPEMSSQEIAQQLTLHPTLVKWHIDSVE